MEFKKNISLTAYEVEYIDLRQEKPRTARRETVVLDGGIISALNRLGMRPAGYIAQQFEHSGHAVTSIHKGETIGAQVNLSALWTSTMMEIQAEKAKSLMKQAYEESEARQ